MGMVEVEWNWGSVGDMVEACSVVPTGLKYFRGINPGDESPGYYRSVPTGLKRATTRDCPYGRKKMNLKQDA